MQFDTLSDLESSFLLFPSSEINKPVLFLAILLILL